jgi:hypothetical protein
MGYVLVESSLFRDAIAPLVEALPTPEEQPEYAQDIDETIIDLLRHAYAGDAAGVAKEWRAITGLKAPDWIKQPPSSPEG